MASDTIVLNLVRNPDGQVFAKSFELLTGQSHTRTSFKGDPLLHNVLSDDLFAQLSHLIARAVNSRMLLLADHVIDLGDLVLHGVRLMTTPAKHGLEYIMVRFISFVGRLNALFRAEYCLPQRPDMTVPELESSAMETVLMSLFNFSAHLERDMRHRCLTREEEAYVENLLSEIAKLKYNADLLGYLMSCRGISEPPSEVGSHFGFPMLQPRQQRIAS